MILPAGVATVHAAGIGPLIFFGRRFSQIGNADRARIFFIVGSRFFYADGDLGLLRGGRIGAD